MNPETATVEIVLSLVRQWGWETGLRKLGAAIDARPDAQQKEALRFSAGWTAAERGAYDEADRLFTECQEFPGLAGWATFGRAFMALRQRDYPKARSLLAEAARRAEANDRPLAAAIAHLRGTTFFHEGRSEQALAALGDALELFGKDHFGTGRVLDTFGMVYAGRDNFHAAEEFFHQALRCKERFEDRLGLALTQGNLGRLYLDWDNLDKADSHFKTDLKLSLDNHIEDGETQMYNHLGQVALARGEQEAASGRHAEARKQWATAADWLDLSIQQAAERGYAGKEGYARKDRALLHLAHDEVAAAADQAARAEALFRAGPFPEGIAHVNRVWGIIQRRQGQWEPSLRALRVALDHFQKARQKAEIARTQFEIARTHRAANAPHSQLKSAYLEALKAAESCRRAVLVRRIEDELRILDPETYYEHVYRRVRGPVAADTSSLVATERNVVTVLYLDLKDSTLYALKHDPEVVLGTLNQMMADFVTVLRRYDALVSGFRGDGFLALFRDRDHAVRAVSAALDLLRELEEFNRPRQVLGLSLFIARIGIATGGVCLGNVGTYDKMDYTAIGTTANLGARLESAAQPGQPCICTQTHDIVRERFRYGATSPRKPDLKGLDPQPVWDVIGHAELRALPP